MNRRYVLDINTIISAIFWPDSVPAQAVVKARQGTLLMSQAIVAEWDEVIRRPKFDKLRSLADRLAALQSVVDSCQFVDVEPLSTACRDPKDNKFLDVATAARATL